ncbi:MAG: hypothetical protein R3314_06200 [Longimicrobiales bacterium]|nr:hypothetical protein [Longimicrobiales bacterium]
MRLIRSLPLLLIAPFVAGCVSFSIFQGPETLEQGELTGGVAASFYSLPGDTAGDGQTGGPWPELGVRYGLGANLDLGVKFAGIPPFGTTYADLRWQITDAPVPVTAGLGGSYVSWDPGNETDTFSFSALYPSLAVGTDRLWVAGRGIIVSAGTTGDLFVAERLWGIVAGTSIGDRVRLLPELQVYFGENDPLVGLGLGLQFRIREPEG